MRTNNLKQCTFKSPFGWIVFQQRLGPSRRVRRGFVLIHYGLRNFAIPYPLITSCRAGYQFHDLPISWQHIKDPQTHCTTAQFTARYADNHDFSIRQISVIGVARRDLLLVGSVPPSTHTHTQGGDSLGVEVGKPVDTACLLYI